MAVVSTPNIRNLIDSDEACEFLRISLPTFNKLRAQHSLEEIQGKRKKIYFKKNEIITKIIEPSPSTLPPVDLTFSNNPNLVEEIKYDSNTFDIRAINLIDPYGVTALLSEVHALASKSIPVNFIIDHQYATSYLLSLDFFKVIKRQYRQLVFWSEEISPELSNIDFIFPIKTIGFVGQDKSATEELTNLLASHGFSDSIAGYIGWLLGELTDNSLTHSEKAPCYILASRYSGKNDYLEIGIVDCGIGIQNSLKKNPRYSNLSDKALLLTAFKPNVSGRSDEEERGKGLTDVLNISMSNRSMFKVDSCDISIFFSFLEMQKSIEFVNPISRSPGVRFSFVLIDSEFQLGDRASIDEILDDNLEKI